MRNTIEGVGQEMNVRPIRDREGYLAAMSQAEAIIARDPTPDSPEAEKLEVLSLVIADYEKKNFFFDVPDPISAIEFRMEEQGLRQRDLIPILGSRSRVSEILSRKRPLTLPMIRALSENLGIPTDVLIRSPKSYPADHPVTDELAWSKFPFQAMRKRGWLSAEPRSTPAQIQSAVQQFLFEASGIAASAPLYRRSLTGLGVDGLEDSAKYAVLAWSARIFQKAKIHGGAVQNFLFTSVTDDFFRALVVQSKHVDGPKRAISMLADIGIQVIFEPALPGSLIDGAAFLATDMRPIIGLTLRFDRVDYFWFTLLHELAHVWKHLNTPNDGFIDRIDATDDGKRREQEANRIARDTLIPRQVWNRSTARIDTTLSSIIDLAAELSIHPAIVAGRIHYESGKYGRFRSLMGQGSVRKQFIQ